jgi:hypothetical protein
VAVTADEQSQAGGDAAATVATEAEQLELASEDEKAQKEALNCCGVSIAVE